MKNRIKKPLTTAVPTRAEMETALGEIRNLKIGLLKINADREAAIKEIDDRIGPFIEVGNKALADNLAIVQAWAEANPAEFEKKKSLDLAHGTIGFRTGTPKLALLSRAWTWAKSLVEVQAHLPNFVRSTPEIDKEALIAQREDEAIQWALPRCGLQITQGETFFVEPKIEEIEITEKKAA